MRGVCRYPYEIVTDGSGNYVLSPKEGTPDEFVVTLPPGVLSSSVIATVPTSARIVKAPESVKVTVYKESGDSRYDITEYLDISRNTLQAGVVEWNVGDATLNETKKAELQKAILNFAPTSGDAEDRDTFEPMSDTPITTAKTVPGLAYTLYESSSLQNLYDSPGAYTVGNGSPWRPKVSEVRGSSRFYAIRVSK